MFGLIAESLGYVAGLRMGETLPAEVLGMSIASEAVARVKDLACELAYIEALRDRLLRGSYPFLAPRFKAVTEWTILTRQHPPQKSQREPMLWQAGTISLEVRSTERWNCSSNEPANDRSIYLTRSSFRSMCR